MDEPKALQRLWLHGYYMNYDEADYDGVKYLRDDLATDEAKVFFMQAYAQGEAQFEDDYDRQFSLKYENSDYTLYRRT
ncbi:MAG TPA: hypothetical protein VJK04_00600 [Candidatus Paceibacterota bacterium]